MPLDQPEEVYPYEKNMGFFDHIDELRKRLFRVARVHAFRSARRSLPVREKYGIF